MKVTAEQLAKLDPQIVKFHSGNSKASATRPWPPDHALAGSLVFVSSIESLKKALDSATIIVAVKKIIPTSLQLKSDQALFETPAANAAMAIINGLFDQKAFTLFQWNTYPSFDSSLRKIGKDVRIGAFSVIGENVHIGDGAILGPHCVVEKNARLGAQTLLHAFVFIGADCEVGKHCEIHPHVTVGSDGFGFIPRENNSPIKIPQLGNVIIEDDVEIGGNCVIDRGALTETRICKSAKLDNLVHIAHNCKVGPNSLIAAGFMMAGSSSVGANFMCGGNVVVADHVHITDNVSLGGKSAATNDITEPGAYTGYPLVPMKEGLKYIASLPKLPEIRKQLSQIRKHLGLDKLN